MADSNKCILFTDIFDVKDIDADGKVFDKVSRLTCQSQSYEMDLLLDINIDIYPVEMGERFSIAIASSLSLHGQPDDGNVYDQSNQASLLDRYEYAMYGRVFRYTEDKARNNRVSLYASFGGLLMRLTGDPHYLSNITLEQRVYLLMRKV